CSFTGGRVAPAQDSKGSLQEQSDKWFAVGVHQFVPILAILYLRKPWGYRPPDFEERAKRYVPIPSQYADPDKSGLTYTVKPGKQPYDIKLQ
ncbi:MAG TPA: hypothetical protein VMG10_10180, partial [Gemmataceae bacterium]|nr:hypothetical protein [Gemmataceae bacterium]